MKDLFNGILDKLNNDERLEAGAALAPFVLCLILFWYGIEFDIPIRSLVLDSSAIFFGSFILCCIDYVIETIRKRRLKKIKSKVFFIVILIYFALSILYIPKLFGYKTMQIGDFYEAEEYKAKYYVIMSRDPDGSAVRKEYKLPAEIERRTDYLYHINYIFFSNGGYLNFTDRDDEDTTLSPDKETRCIDNKNEYYYITLTKEKCN